MNIFSDNHDFFFGSASYKNGDNYGPVLHTKLAMLFLYKGEVEVTCDGNTYLVKNEQVTLVYSENSVEYKFVENTEHNCSWCDLNTPLFDRYVIKELKSLPLVLPISNRLRTLHEEGLSLALGGGSSRSLLRNTIGQAIYYEYFDQAKLDIEKPLPEDMKRILNFIETHVSEHLSIKDISDSMGISAQNLISKFQEYMRMTPSKYIWKLRARKSFESLVHTNKPVAQIAYDNGFQTPQHFSRFIKEHYGYSPTELRRREQ